MRRMRAVATQGVKTADVVEVIVLAANSSFTDRLKLPASRRPVLERHLISTWTAPSCLATAVASKKGKRPHPSAGTECGQSNCDESEEKKILLLGRERGRVREGKRGLCFLLQKNIYFSLCQKKTKLCDKWQRKSRKMHWDLLRGVCSFAQLSKMKLKIKK